MFKSPPQHGYLLYASREKKNVRLLKKKLERGRWRSSFLERRRGERELATRPHSSSRFFPRSPLFFLFRSKMQSALLARSGAPSFAAQRRVARPRAVAARAQVKAPQVNTRSAREASLSASLVVSGFAFIRRCQASSVSLFSRA